MMKALLIFPPFYSQFSISCGIPQIISYLKAKNHDVKALDLNIKFFNYLYKMELGDKVKIIDMDKDRIEQVLLNIISNCFIFAVFSLDFR